MKRLPVTGIALFCVAIACTREDTRPQIVWPRTLKVRLTSLPEPAVKPGGDCAGLDITTHAEAAWVLGFMPQCMDDAIGALDRFAARDARAMSDLAAAYYLRAKQKDRPVDYLRAWDAVTHALLSVPELPEAKFNRDLIEEALGLRPTPRAEDALAQWRQSLAPLDDALCKGDRATVARLIAPFPNAAQRYVYKSGYKLLAEEVSRLTGEPVEGSLAVQLQIAIDVAYWNVTHTRERDAFSRGAIEFEKIEREARARGYGRVALRALVTHAWCMLYDARYLDSLAEYDRAIAEYEQMGDADALTDTRMRRMSALRLLGQSEMAWREARELMHDHLWQLTQPRSREALLNEVCTNARSVGYPAVALQYANVAIDAHRRALQAFAGDPQSAQRALGSALRERATLEAALDRAPAAEADLDEAARLGDTEVGAAREHLQGRIAAARGALLSRTNPSRAIAEFSGALKSARLEPPTVRAALLFQRAEARLSLGQNEEAESDFKSGLKVLRDEELGEVRARPGLVTEDYWSGYFSRFQDSFRKFVSYLIESKQIDAAFGYAERARAFEPLSRLMEAADIDAITPERIREDLPPHTVILEYCIVGDRTVVFIVSRERTEARVLDVDRRKVERWRSDLQDERLFETALNAASAELLPKALAAIPGRTERLVIVPDGALHALPFAALHDQRTGRYLIQDYPIAIAGSAKLYLLSLRRDRELAASANAKALLVGDPLVSPALSLARGLPALRRARSEVERIASCYVESDTLVGAEATIPRFFALAPGSAVIHIAAHAIPNPSEPQHSVIVLAPSAGDKGALDAERLRTDLSLKHTRLVVLAACSSAGGLPIGPEGLAPLVRPLVAAGVPAVIGSLWDVKDATAETLLVSFHRRYAEGLDAAAAMQAAQIEMIGNTKQTGQQRPMAWAAFQVIGYSSSPAASRRNR